MKRRLSAMEARKRFGELLESVYHRGDEVVIERAGKVMGVMISIDLYRSMEASRERIMELIERSWERNKDRSYEEVQKLVDEAIAAERRRPKAAARK